MDSNTTKTPSPALVSLKSFVSGGFGGSCLVLVGHPFDLIKVRLQTSNMYSGVIDCARRTIKADGLTGLYRGVTAPLIGVTPIFAASFWGYDVGKVLARLLYNQEADHPLSLTQIMIAGGFSALPCTVIMTPGERVKIMLQTDGLNNTARKYTSTWDCVKKLARQEGLGTFYRGTAATLLRDVPGSIAYFGTYELLKDHFTENGTKTITIPQILLSGGMSGIANWIVSIGPDTLKSRLQAAEPGTYTGVIDVFQKMMKTEGPMALFKGLRPVLLRAFPANAACFLGFEFINYVFKQFFGF